MMLDSTVPFVLNSTVPFVLQSGTVMFPACNLNSVCDTTSLCNINSSVDDLLTWNIRRG